MQSGTLGVIMLTTTADHRSLPAVVVRCIDLWYTSQRAPETGREHRERQ